MTTIVYGQPRYPEYQDERPHTSDRIVFESFHRTVGCQTRVRVSAAVPKMTRSSSIEIEPEAQRMEKQIQASVSKLVKFEDEQR